MSDKINDTVDTVIKETMIKALEIAASAAKTKAPEFYQLDGKQALTIFAECLQETANDIRGV